MSNGSSNNDPSWKGNSANINSHWSGSYGSGGYYGTGYNDYDYGYSKPKRKHSFTPVLLIVTTVYDCEHCGAKKEDCTSDYCDEPETHYNDQGDWG